MKTLSFERKVIATLGFVALGLSPSYVDWQQSPDKRKSMIIYYSVTVALLWAGLLA